jgi:hypothetical protein
MTCEEATDPLVATEMTGGHDRIITLALAFAQRLP